MSNSFPFAPRETPNGDETSSVFEAGEDVFEEVGADEFTLAEDFETFVDYDEVEHVDEDTASSIFASDDDDEVSSLFASDAVEDVDSSTTISIFEQPTHNPNDEILTVEYTNAEGQSTVAEINVSSPELTREEAIEITNSIKTAASLTYVLLKRAQAGKAYKALGYSNFSEYLKQEVGITTTHAYKLLSHGDVVSAIEEKAPEGSRVVFPVALGYAMRRALPEIIEQVEALPAGISAEDASHAIEGIIRDQRDGIEREKHGGDEAENPFDGENEGGESGGGDWDGEKKPRGEYDPAAEYLNGEEDPEGDDGDSFVDGEAPASNRKYDDLFAIYSGLRGIADRNIADVTELFAVVPDDLVKEFDEFFTKTTPWLLDAAAKWKSFRENESGSLDENMD